MPSPIASRTPAERALAYDDGVVAMRVHATGLGLVLTCVLAAALAGCAISHPPGDASTATSCFGFVPDGGFWGTIAVDIEVERCPSSTCMAFMFRGDPSCVEGTASCGACPPVGPSNCVSSEPSLASNSLARIFCTPRCAPDGSCPDGWQCDHGFSHRFPGAPYCVPLDPFLAAGGCRDQADCAGGETCDVDYGRCRGP